MRNRVISIFEEEFIDGELFDIEVDDRYWTKIKNQGPMILLLIFIGLVILYLYNGV